MSYRSWISGSFILLMLAGAADCAEFEIHPSIAVSEEYNDNIFETNTNRVTDYITHATPGINLSYKAPALSGNISYTFDYMYYARNSRDNDTYHNLAANGKLTAVENLFFVEVSDTYTRVSLDVSRDVSKESSFVNQTDQNTASVSPYFTLRPTQQTNVKAGYRFVDIRYDEPTGTSNTAGVDKINHVAFLDASYEFTPNWSVTCGYNFTREEADVGSYNMHQGNIGFRYEYANKSFLFAQGGYTWTSYDNGQRLNNEFWNAGATHNFDTVSATLTTGVRYDEDPLANITQHTFVTGNIDKQLQRGSLGLTLDYSEFTQANTDTLQTRTYGGTIRGNYELTESLKGNVAFSAEKYDQATSSYTRRFQVVSGLSYSLAKQLTVSLSHTFVDYYSPDITSDNKQVNRIMLAINKTF